MSSWHNLPPHVFEEIFYYFSIRELKTLSLVCRGWLTNIDALWRNEILFNVDRLQNDEDLEVFSSSQRYFVNFCITFEASENIDVIRKFVKILKNREAEGNPPHVEYIKLPVYYEIFEILENLGSSVKTIELCTGSSDVEECQKSLQNLSSVEKLVIHEGLEQLYDLANFFKKLVHLHIERRNINECFLDFLKIITTNNKNSLESLTIIIPETYAKPWKIWSASDFYFLEDLQKLRHFTIDTKNHPGIFRAIINSARDLKSLKLEVESLEHEDLKQINENLQTLTILIIKASKYSRFSFTKGCLSKIWSLENLQELELHCCDYSKEDFSESLKYKTLNLKSITLDDVYFDSDVWSLIFKKCAYLKKFHLINPENEDSQCAVSFRLLQDAAEQLKFLEDLVIHSHFHTHENGLINDSKECSTFSYLKSLKLINIDSKFLKEIKAPKLETMDFSGFTRLDDEGLKTVCENCPCIEYLDLYYCAEITDSCIEEVSKKLKFLKVICTHICISLTLDAVRSIVANCKYLRYADLGYFSAADDESFEKELQEIRMLRNPPLNFREYNMDFWSLISKNKLFLFIL